MTDVETVMIFMLGTIIGFLLLIYWKAMDL